VLQATAQRWGSQQSGTRNRVAISSHRERYTAKTSRVNENAPHIDCLGIVGVGLIGGSIARAARSRRLCARVLGCGRSEARLQQAQDLGVIDEFTTDIEKMSGCDLIVVCTPVRRIADDVNALLRSTDALITDAGSVKGSIITAIDVEHANRFVPSHPLAGSHHSGFEHADPDLFENRHCVVTPTKANSKSDIEEVVLFWQSLGMTVNGMFAEEHDRILAITSHLPHLVAAACAKLVDDKAMPYAATGFRDTTRVALGDPDLWTSIFAGNREHAATAVDAVIRELLLLRDAIQNEDWPTLRDLLAQAKQHREAFHRSNS